MNTILISLLLFIGIGIAIWLVSFVIELLRPIPPTPVKLIWNPNIPVNYIEIDGAKLRYIKTGDGPTLVLLHTLRTQLDLFHKVIDELSQEFTVYALDYPGHGYSDIPDAEYDANYFADCVEQFIEKLDLKNITLSGVSIGGAISLITASRNNPRVSRIIPINPYDYAKGSGMGRSSQLGAVTSFVSQIPFLGETFMRLRNFIVMKSVLNGGVADPNSISPELMKELYKVGNRKNHYRAFLKLLRNSESWQQATKDYGNINIPVLFIWGSEDWAKPYERDHDVSLVPNAKMVTIESGGHFLPLDKPQAVISTIKEFVRNS